MQTQLGEMRCGCLLLLCSLGSEQRAGLSWPARPGEERGTQPPHPLLKPVHSQCRSCLR